MRRTLKNVLTEYGAIGVVLYLAIFAIVLFGSWLAIRAGWSPSSAAGKTSTFAAAYIITKITQPLRIGVTVVLTPIVARIWEKATGNKRPVAGIEVDRKDEALDPQRPSP
jgi:hypothetical protein